MKINRKYVWALTLGMAYAVPAHAQEWVALSGAEFAGQGSYVFAGGLIPLGSGTLGSGLQGRVWADRLQYQYKVNETTVTAIAPGAQLALGYKMPTANGAWSLYGGLGQRRTRLSPDQPGADNSGSHSGFTLLAEAYQLWPEGWRSDENYSYEIGPDSYWLRVKGSKAAPGDGLRHGLALVASGGPDYHINKLGYAVDGFNIGSGLSMNLGLGVSQARDLDAVAYLAVELVYVQSTN